MLLLSFAFGQWGKGEGLGLCVEVLQHERGIFASQGWYESLGGRSWWDAGCHLLPWSSWFALSLGKATALSALSLQWLAWLFLLFWYTRRATATQRDAAFFGVLCLLLAMASAKISLRTQESLLGCFLAAALAWRAGEGSRWRNAALCAMGLAYLLAAFYLWAFLLFWLLLLAQLVMKRSPLSLLFHGALASLLGILLSSGSWWPAWAAIQDPHALPLPSDDAAMLSPPSRLFLPSFRKKRQTHTFVTEQRDQRFLQKLHLFFDSQGISAKTGGRLLLLEAELLPWGEEAKLGMGALRWKGGQLSQAALFALCALQEAGKNKAACLRTQDAAALQKRLKGWKRLQSLALLKRWDVRWLLSPYPIQPPYGAFQLAKVLREDKRRLWIYRVLYPSSAYERSGDHLIFSRLWHRGWYAHFPKTGAMEPLQRCDGAWLCLRYQGKEIPALVFVPPSRHTAWGLFWLGFFLWLGFFWLAKQEGD
jgi:hypothetical protein